MIIFIFCSSIALQITISSLNNDIGLFGGLFHVTVTSHIFQIFIFIITTIILQLTSFFPRRIWIQEYSSLYKLLFFKLKYLKNNLINKMAEQYRIIEYPLILLFIITGAVFLISSSDIVSIFLSIELQSYGLYLLATIYRNSELATSAGLIYFLLGGLSSCIILLGTSLLYANSGTTSLDGYYVIISISDILNNLSHNILYWYKANYINFSLLIISIGFLFKVSAAPFHFWSPDVYDAIPTIVTTFVAIIAKISIFIFLLELIHYTSNSYFSLNFNWTFSLLVSCFLSLIIGTILGLNQFRIKRLFAYSTISHLGFILLAISINSLESIQAFVFYLMQYSLSNLNVFLLLLAIGYSLYLYTNEDKEYHNLLDKNNSPIQLTTQIKGYFYINPMLALSLTITIFSFIGIPPLVGFFAKQMVLSAALDNGFIFLTIVAILTSVISAVYYLNIIKQVFFDESEYKLNTDLDNLELKINIVDNNNIRNKIIYKIKDIVLSSTLSISISILTLIILLFIFNPSSILSLASILAIFLFNT
jgi:NADH-ubiquinone oxidoreductase chain 2